MEKSIKLKIENLSVKVGNKLVLKNINLQIPEGEVHILFGPNGSGKSTLLKTIMGMPNYKIIEGKIIFKGKDITHLPIYERAKLGIGIGFQNPPSIKGVKLGYFLYLINKTNTNIKEEAKAINLQNFLDRDLNLNFSGGELKRAEILQLYLQDPDFIMLDEPESGVDLGNIKLISKYINKMLSKDKPMRHRKKSGLIITHTGYILDYIITQKGYILMDGEIQCFGTPLEMFKRISETGFKDCINCLAS